jgi:sterigmatocystin biosynthesis cytochrome P450 monooxygenase
MIDWGSFGSSLNPFKRWNPIRPLVVAYHGNKISKYIGAVLEDNLSQRRSEHGIAQESKPKQTKSMAELLVDAYLVEHGDRPGPMEPMFKYLSCAQLRLFLIGGHDTTSSTLVYTYHLLYENPGPLARLRAEHNEVFGEDISKAGARIAADPTLLNKLPYTNACIKETMRIFPPASAMRVGTPGIVLKDRHGTLYPTAGCNVWSLHLAMHRSPELFKEPRSFIPERWLVGPDHPLYPPKGGYRPFEFGPRSCPGQTLSIMEVTVTLAMTVREFDIHNAYAEWDEAHPSKRIRVAFGDRPYAVEGGGGGSHAVDRYPCRVSIARGLNTTSIP